LEDLRDFSIYKPPNAVIDEGADEMVETLYLEMLKKIRILDIGERRISRTVREYRGRSRYVIYLPVTRNDVWKILWEKRIPVKVFLELPEEAIKKSFEEDWGGD
jgi:hypothetical protein